MKKKTESPLQETLIQVGKSHTQNKTTKTNNNNNKHQLQIARAVIEIIRWAKEKLCALFNCSRKKGSKVTL